MSSKCKSCGAPILWAITVQGNAMPLDEKPVENGNVLLTGRRQQTKAGSFTPECRVEGGPPLFDDGAPRYLSHHATCPDADQWRK